MRKKSFLTLQTIIIGDNDKFPPSQDIIRRLEEQLKQLQAAKDELEARQKELQAMMERLEESKNMEAAERAKLEEEIRAKQDEVQRIQSEVELKDQETRRLQVLIHFEMCRVIGFVSEEIVFIIFLH